MTNLIYDVVQELIKPTYLMIKIHSVTRLKYFCKTTRNPEKYKGSGTYWRRHIEKHGKEFIVNELVIGPYVIKSELASLALWMSTKLDIVNSPDWANLVPENGSGGGCNKGVLRGPQTGKSAKGVLHGPAIGKSAKGMPNTGKSAKGMPKTGKTAKGEPNLGRAAKGILRGPATGRNAKGVLKTGRNARGVPRKPYGAQSITTCEYCGKSGGIGNMKRYHGDNCRKQPTL